MIRRVVDFLDANERLMTGGDLAADDVAAGLRGGDRDGWTFVFLDGVDLHVDLDGKALGPVFDFRSRADCLGGSDGEVDEVVIDEDGGEVGRAAAGAFG